jgi:hypothetical protein
MTQERGKWLAICEAMVREADPAKMLELAARLVAALDEQKVGSAPPSNVFQPETAKPQSKYRSDQGVGNICE